MAYKASCAQQFTVLPVANRGRVTLSVNRTGVGSPREPAVCFTDHSSCLQITTVDEAKQFYPLFGLGANVALIFSGRTVKYFSQVDTQLYISQQSALLYPCAYILHIMAWSTYRPLQSRELQGRSIRIQGACLKLH